MPDRGQLTFDKLQYSMPATSPLYPEPPIRCPEVESVMISFETDRDIALSLLPEPLELMEPASGLIGLLNIPYGAIGTYQESLLVINCLYKGVPYRYDVGFLVTNDLSLAFGREALGAPKKLGHVVLEHRPEGVYGYAERPKGHRLMSLGMTLDEQIQPDALTGQLFAGSICLRIIPNPAGHEIPLMADLIEIPVERQVVEMWRGKGMVTFPENSEIDDWSVLPINKITDAIYSVAHVDMLSPKLLLSMHPEAALKSGKQPAAV
jgi:acetoacetate decarboxylase